MSTRKPLLLTLLCLMGSLLVTPHPAQAQDAFRDIDPKAQDFFGDIDPKASDVLERLHHKSIDSQPSFYRAGRRGLTHYMAVFSISRCVERVEKDNKDKSLNKKPAFTKAEIAVIRGYLKEYENDIKMTFKKIPSEMYVILDTIPPFLDVPSTHWAFTAVQALKEADIFVGYPTQGKNTFLYHAPKH